jgi:amino acid transporter
MILIASEAHRDFFPSFVYAAPGTPARCGGGSAARWVEGAMGEGLAAVRAAVLALSLVPAAAHAELVTIIAPPDRPDQFYMVPQHVISPDDRSNQRALRNKLQGPARSWWGPQNITTRPDTRGTQWYIFPVCNGVVTAPGKLVDIHQTTVHVRCP